MSMSEETNFVEQGSLEKPLLIGRLVRFALGLLLIDGAYQVAIGWPHFLENGFPLDNVNLWIVALLALWTLPAVVNIGFSLNTKRLVQFIVLGVSALLAAYHYLSQGVIMGDALSIFTLVWIHYWLIHLGLSFFLAGILATPGCEMRAIPHLWSLATGRSTKEHFCPGFLDPLDRWERARRPAR